MKIYNKIPLPEDTAWDRKSWRRFVHWRIKYFIDGVRNIFRWIPTIYHDRDFDHYFITKILQKKIKHQRDYLVKQNSYSAIEYDSYWMTVVLNLIEREHEEYYGMEYMNYEEIGCLDKYLARYANTKRRVLRENRGIDFTDKKRLALYVSSYRQQKCRNLLFEILKRKSACWWD